MLFVIIVTYLIVDISLSFSKYLNIDRYFITLLTGKYCCRLIRDGVVMNFLSRGIILFLVANSGKSMS